MKTISLLLLISLFLVSCNSGKTNGNDDQTKTENDKTADIPNAGGKLYLRTFMMGTSLNIQWVYLGDDGTIVYDPTEGANPVSYAAERANQNTSIGKYNIDGNQLHINWDGGSVTNSSIEFQDGDIHIIDGGITTRQTGVPAGFKLNGQYAGGAITKNLSVTNTYQFYDNGTFTLHRKGAASIKDKDGVPVDHTATSEDDVPGRYDITGNTLTVQFDDGTEQKAVIGIMNMRGGLQYLVINESTFKLEK